MVSVWKAAWLPKIRDCAASLAFRGGDGVGIEAGEGADRQRPVVEEPCVLAHLLEHGQLPDLHVAVTLAATVASTYLLDMVATAAGVALAASHLLRSVDHWLIVALLVVSYVVWGIGLRAASRRTGRSSKKPGTNTSALSKAVYDLAGLRRGSDRLRLFASQAGYVSTEIAKEIAYYAGAFGAALLSDSVSSNDALVFLAGANLGAAAHEYALGRLTRTFLRLRTRHAATPARAGRPS